MRKTVPSILACVMVTLSSRYPLPASASEGWLAAAPKVGTLGIGGDVIVKVAPTVNARVGANFLNLRLDHTFSDIEYGAKLKFMSYSALLDWHVFNGTFRISGGALFNQNKADLLHPPGERGGRSTGGPGEPDKGHAGFHRSVHVLSGCRVELILQVLGRCPP